MNHVAFYSIHDFHYDCSQLKFDLTLEKTERRKANRLRTILLRRERNKMKLKKKASREIR